MTGKAPPCAVHQTLENVRPAFALVPDLTSGMSIKPNLLVLLRLATRHLAWLQVVQIAISPRLSTARLGVAALPVRRPPPHFFEKAFCAQEVNSNVTIEGLMFFLFAFVAGYLVALLRERNAPQRERNAKQSDQRSKQHS
jgi:hypothetical protein